MLAPGRGVEPRFGGSKPPVVPLDHPGSTRGGTPHPELGALLSSIRRPFALRPPSVRTQASPAFGPPASSSNRTFQSSARRTAAADGVSTGTAHSARLHLSAAARRHATSGATSSLGWAAAHSGRRGTTKGRRHPGPTHRRSAHGNETVMRNRPAVTPRRTDHRLDKLALHVVQSQEPVPAPVFRPPLRCHDDVADRAHAVGITSSPPGTPGGAHPAHRRGVLPRRDHRAGWGRSRPRSAR